mmetsp:Transcript_32070/g.92127  ORF Transcript_32070/g.92127 Transcript_32070/m.92127 type:complete len:529 (-) Transcript_32070:122-1708(-)
MTRGPPGMGQWRQPLLKGNTSTSGSADGAGEQLEYVCKVPSVNVKRMAAQNNSKLPTPLITSPFPSTRTKLRTDAGQQGQGKDTRWQLRRHIAICCIVMFAEGFYATHLFPYVSAMTEDLRNTKQSLGAFTGLVYTAQSAGMLCSALLWAKASNFYGRRLCLMIGLCCNVLTTLAVALSTDYWAIAGLRLLSGLLNNNLSIIRTSLRERFAMAGEDDTAAFSLLSVAFGASSVAGPSLGGVLYGILPADMWPLQPWSPPMLMCTTLYFTSFVVVACCLPETADLQTTRGDGPVASSGSIPEAPVYKRPLLRKRRFLMLLAMGGGHSYVFTGWELVYPLLAREPRAQGGEEWRTSDIGFTFLVGSVGLMLYSLFVYPKLAKRMSVLHLWIYQWGLPLLAMPAFPRVLDFLVRAGAASRSLPVLLVNYGTQLVVSVMLGSCFIGIQLLLNGYVSEEPDSQRLLALANSYLVTTQALVRAVSPMISGSLFTLGIHGDLGSTFGAALPFDHLAVVGFACGVLCAIAFERRTP